MKAEGKGRVRTARKVAMRKRRFKGGLALHEGAVKEKVGMNWPATNLVRDHWGWLIAAVTLLFLGWPDDPTGLQALVRGDDLCVGRGRRGDDGARALDAGFFRYGSLVICSRTA